MMAPEPPFDFIERPSVVGAIKAKRPIVISSLSRHFALTTPGRLAHCALIRDVELDQAGEGRLAANLGRFEALPVNSVRSLSSAQASPSVPCVATERARSRTRAC